VKLTIEGVQHGTALEICNMPDDCIVCADISNCFEKVEDMCYDCQYADICTKSMREACEKWFVEGL